MYTAIHYEKETGVIIFDDVQGKIELEYKPYYWKPSSEKSDYHTIFGQPVQRTYRYSKDYYEIDVSPTTRILLDRYDETVAKNTIAYIDIETSSEGGFPSIIEGNREILSITTLINNTVYVLVVSDKNINLSSENIEMKKLNGETIPFNFEVKISKCQNDTELLEKFSKLIIKKSVSVITDWNGDRFDIPYIINRMKRLGVDYNRLSPIGLIKQREGGFYSIGCINHLDYMELYKKYSINDRPSYSLNSICELELGIGKIQHSGLDSLYKTDIDKFLEYNIRDVILLWLLENQLNYLQIAIYLSHKTHIPYEQVFQQTRIIEGGIFLYFKNHKLVSINRPEKSENESAIEGAYVKDPVTGIHKNIIDLDFTSLYPNILRTLNISTETKIGKVINWRESLKDFYNMNQGKEYDDRQISVSVNGKTSNTNLSKLKEWLDKRNYSIACNGVMYSLDKMGFIGNIITEWFDERILYKNLRKKAEKEGDHEKVKEYDIKQYVMKILMNSFYGALAMPGFRYYDRDMAESVTVTGQFLTKLSERNVNEYFR